MNHAVDGPTREQRRDDVPVEHAAALDHEGTLPRPQRTLGAGRELAAVEQDDFIAALEQRVNHVEPDEACAARDENRHQSTVAPEMRTTSPHFLFSLRMKST